MFSSLFYPSISPKIEVDSGPSVGPIVPFLGGFLKNASSSLGPSAPASGGGYQIGFDDVLYVVRNIGPNRPYLLINTLPPNDQEYLIKNTLACQLEESTINGILDDFRVDLNQYVIVVYGRHCADASVNRKWKQLTGLGFKRVYMYYGGMFEWCLLQDIYGDDVFLVGGDSTKKKDPLYFAPPKLWE
jgi:hypothetical protein